MPILFIDKPWSSTIETSGVTITYHSGDETFISRMRRADYRRGLETELQRLNAWEREELCRVVPFKKRKGEH